MAPKKKNQRARAPASTEPTTASTSTRRSARVGRQQPVSTEPASNRRANRGRQAVQESDDENAGLPSERGKRAQHRTKEISMPGVTEVRESDQEIREDTEEEQLELHQDRTGQNETQDTIYLRQERAQSVYEDAPESTDAALASANSQRDFEHVADLSGTTFGNAARVSGASTQFGDAAAAPTNDEAPVSNEEQLGRLCDMVEALNSLDWAAPRIIKSRTDNDVYNGDTYESEDVELFYREFNDPKSATSRKTRPARGGFRDAFDAIEKVSGAVGGLYIDVRHVIDAFASKFHDQTGVDLSGRLTRAELILYMANLALFLDDMEALHKPGKAYFILDNLKSADAFTTLHTINELFLRQFASGLGRRPSDTNIESTIDVAISVRVQLFFETLRDVEDQPDITAEEVLRDVFFEDERRNGQEERVTVKGWAGSGLQTQELTAQDKARIEEKLSTIGTYMSNHDGTLKELREDLQNHLGMDPGELRWEMVRWASRRAKEIRTQLGELPGDTESFKKELYRILEAQKARLQHQPSTNLPTRISSVKTGLREEAPAHAASQTERETEQSRSSARATTDIHTDGERESGAGTGSKDKSTDIFEDIEGDVYQGTEEHDALAEDDFVPQPEGDDDHDNNDDNGMTQQDRDLGKQLGVENPRPPFPLSSRVPNAAKSTKVPANRVAPRFIDTQPDARRTSPIHDTQDDDETREERRGEGVDGGDQESEADFQADTRNLQSNERRRQLANRQAIPLSRKRGRAGDEAESPQTSPAKRQRVNQEPQDDPDDQHIPDAGDDLEVVEAENNKKIKKVKTSTKQQSNGATKQKSNDNLPVRSGRIAFSPEEDEHLLEGIKRYHERHDTMSRIRDPNGWDRCGIFAKNGRRNQDLSNRARILRVKHLIDLRDGNEHLMPSGLNSIPLKAVDWDKLAKYGFEKPSDEATRRRKAAAVITIASDEDETEDGE